MDNFRILAVVKFNNGEALVLDRKLELVYTKYGNKTIVGTDGIFYQCYYHDCRGGMNAFAGREFDLTMEDGEIVCPATRRGHGQKVTIPVDLPQDGVYESSRLPAFRLSFRLFDRCVHDGVRRAV